MSDSPKSDTFGSRFSTPVNELDDHRFQPELPRVVPPERRADRRSTVTEQPGMLSVRDAYQRSDNTAAFDHAIADDDNDDADAEKQPKPSLVVTTERGKEGRSPSDNAAGVTWSADVRDERVEPGNRSAISVDSRRSPSPPDSIEAFSRRPRAGTATSLAPSLLANKSPSIPPRSPYINPKSPHIAPKERRGTFSSLNPIDSEGKDDSSQYSVQDDVCFPQPEDLHDKPQRIDFDELHDFVATYKYSPGHVPNPIAHKTRPPSSDSSAHGLQGLFKSRRSEGDRPFSSLAKTFRKPSTIATTASVNGLDGGDSLDDEEKGFAEKLAAISETTPPEPVNRWAFFSSELEDMIQAPELGGLLMEGETFQHLFELGPDGGVWWLDMLMPSEEEVEAICKAFGIHGLTREDIIQQETREKVELFKSYYFVCFRSFYQMDKDSEFYMEPVNVYAVVFREGILTFTFCPSPHAANVRKRMGRLRDYVSLGSDWICYAFIDDIVDSYGPVIREVEVESETIEDNVFIARPEDSRSILRQIGECRKTVMSLIRLLGGKADVIKGFAKRCNEQYSVAPRQDVGLYLSDIQDHVVTMMSSLSHFEKMLSRSHGNYLAQISVDNIVQGNRTNEVLSKVTFIATILVPLNLVCGLFGMNVNVPGKNADGLGWFFGILGFLLAFVLMCSLVAKRLRII